ncbi:MAG TPA: hypothetical protein VEB22_10680 [Phycisphaerales bacterium]|nr:hypothetical protein [Phycisphaerales bacterium]
MAPTQPAPFSQPTVGGPDAVRTQHEVTSPIIELKGALGLPVDRPVPMNPSDIQRVDDLQDELMAHTSPEGRPPRHDLRIAEWRWLALGVSFVLLCMLIYALVSGIAPIWIGIYGLLAACLLGIGIGPVLYAGLLRGREEREARQTATAVVKDSAVITRRGVAG